ncbi:uncharacterized protein LOC127842956 isoform X3 [Dreissena polymorpha]|nr:uncharacterized protein LOC127842956 isoform X3 [Dreissena polymorpha]
MCSNSSINWTDAMISCHDAGGLPLTKETPVLERFQLSNTSFWTADYIAKDYVQDNYAGGQLIVCSFKILSLSAGWSGELKNNCFFNRKYSCCDKPDTCDNSTCVKTGQWLDAISCNTSNTEACLKNATEFLTPGDYWIRKALALLNRTYNGEQSLRPSKCGSFKDGVYSVGIFNCTDKLISACYFNSTSEESKVSAQYTHCDLMLPNPPNIRHGLHQESPLGISLGVGIGVLVLVILIIAVIIYLRIRLHEQKNEPSERNKETHLDNVHMDVDNQESGKTEQNININDTKVYYAVPDKRNPSKKSPAIRNGNANGNQDDIVRGSDYDDYDINDAKLYYAVPDKRNPSKKSPAITIGNQDDIVRGSDDADYGINDKKLYYDVPDTGIPSKKSPGITIGNASDDQEDIVRRSVDADYDIAHVDQANWSTPAEGFNTLDEGDYNVCSHGPNKPTVFISDYDHLHI